MPMASDPALLTGLASGEIAFTHEALDAPDQPEELRRYHERVLVWKRQQQSKA
jgi:hypothetical protein